MCGIAGFFNSRRDSATHRRTIRDMLASVYHRGPDEAGYYLDDNVAMGVARLCIVDIEGGHQPISDTSDRFWIVYNGEIYNYIELRSELEALGCSFRTSADTEVALYSWIMWGEEAFRKFNGGYALAIYDRHKEKIVLARDRYGKKPLYYTQVNGELVFGSEIKSFLANGHVPMKMDPYSLESIFTIWTPLSHQSCWENIHQIPHSSYLVANKNSINLHAYERLDFDQPQTELSFEDSVQKTREALQQSVKIRLRSDVEVGTYLSGGLDSSITTLLATKESSHQVRSFSLAFEDKDFDETHYQNLLSSHLGTNHNLVRISNDNIVASFPHAVWSVENPVYRTAFVPMLILSELVKKTGIKVILTGEGADETFMGYNIFKETLVREMWRNLKTHSEKAKYVQLLFPYLKHFNKKTNLMVIMYERFVSEKMNNLFSHEVRYSMSKFSGQLVKEKQNGFSIIRKYLEDNESLITDLTAVEKAQWIEFSTLLMGYLLSAQGDRVGFANSVETRCPFLDPNIVNWAFQLPLEWKIKEYKNEKFILKRAFEKELPDEIINRPKMPYRAPDAVVFLSKEQSSDYLSYLLSPAELKKIEWLNYEFANKLLAKLKKTDIDKISQRESQTLIFLISSAMLEKFFVQKDYSLLPGGRPFKGREFPIVYCANASGNKVRKGIET